MITWEDARVRHDTDDDAPQRLLTSHALLGGVASAALVVLGAFTGGQVVTAAFTVTGLVVAWGWPVLLGLPRPRGSSLVLVVGVIALAVVDLASDDQDGMRWLTAALAITLVLAFLHELVRTDGRASLVLSIAGAALGLGLLASGAFFRESMDYADGDLAIVTAVGASTLTLLVDLVWHRRHRLDEWSLPIGLLLGAGLGVALGLTRADLWNVLLVTGLVSAGVSHALRRILAAQPTTDEQVSQLGIGTACTLVVGVVPYLALWALIR